MCIRAHSRALAAKNMPWNCEDNARLRRRSRLKRTQPARPKPTGDDDGTYAAVLLALNRYPDAKRAVIRALYRKIGRTGDYDDGMECP
jgi:hypothetical protein